MKYNAEGLLEMVELYAEIRGYIADEADLSELFDNEIAPSILAEYGRPGIAFDDPERMTQAFNDWTDGLCKSGEIHLEQYNNYAYTGEWS